MSTIDALHDNEGRYANQNKAQAGTVTEAENQHTEPITDEQLAAYRASDAHKWCAAEELLGNLGYVWFPTEGQWF